MDTRAGSWPEAALSYHRPRPGRSAWRSRRAAPRASRARIEAAAPHDAPTLRSSAPNRRYIGRSCGGSPPGPSVSTMSTPFGCSSRPALVSARTASSGPSRCAITPARTTRSNRSRRADGPHVAHRRARSGRRRAPRAGARRRRCAPRARSSSAGDPSMPTTRCAPPSSSCREQAPRAAAEVEHASRVPARPSGGRTRDPR